METLGSDWLVGLGKIWVEFCCVWFCFLVAWLLSSERMEKEKKNDLGIVDHYGAFFSGS